MVNKIKKAAKVAKTIITRKSASNGAEKSSAATQGLTIPMPVVEKRVTNLILRTKNGMKDLDVLHGKLYQSGEFDHTFTQDKADQSDSHPWACFKKIVDVKPYARISGNADGVTLHIYVPEQNFEDTEELVEQFSELFEKLMIGLSKEDARTIVDAMIEMKQKMLKGLRWYRNKLKSARK